MVFAQKVVVLGFDDDRFRGDVMAPDRYVQPLTRINGAFFVVLEALRDKGLRTTEKEFSPNNPRRDAVLWAGIGRDLQN